MVPTLQINEIYACGTYRIAILPNDRRGISEKIWPGARCFLARPKTIPAAIRIDQQTEPVVHLEVRFHLQYQKVDLAPATHCVLEGVGPEGTTIRSKRAEIPQTGIITTFEDFNLATPDQPTIAFGDKGLWQWRILCLPSDISVHHAAEIRQAKATDLELYFFTGNLEEIFGDSLDLALLQLIIPTSRQAYPDGALSLPSIYKQLVERTWYFGGDGNDGRNKLQYEHQEGQGFYMKEFHKGTKTFSHPFQLKDWLNRKSGACNCYDIACFVSIACRLIDGKRAGLVLINPALVYGADFGYMRPGQLFGWPKMFEVNNPFWGRRGEASTTQFDTSRQRFSNHMWVEVNDGIDGQKGRVVLDACQAVGRAPEGLQQGTLSRAAYHRAVTECGPKCDGYVRLGRRHADTHQAEVNVQGEVVSNVERLLR